jgi:hypothetical protein
MKTVGEGFEVGFWQGQDKIFVGNFIHSAEANTWFTMMNKEIKKFSKQYAVGPSFPMTWYKHFAKTHLYKCYYNYLEKIFSGYQKDYNHAFKKDLVKYNKMKKHWHYRTSFFKAA